MMKKRMCICVIFASLLIVLCLLLNVAPPDAPWIAKPQDEYSDAPIIRVIQEESPSVQSQIDTLKDLGFSADKVETEFFLQQLYSYWPEETLMRYPYWLVFTALGMEYDANDPTNFEGEINYRPSPLESENIEHYSDSVFNFMRNSCYTPEHYTYILSQIQRISGGEVVLDNIRSGRVLGIGRLWVSFSLDNVEYKFSIPSSGRRFNPEILTVVSDIAGENSDGKKIFWNGDEQGVHIVYCTKDTLLRLAEQTGINFCGLDDAQIELK